MAQSSEQALEPLLYFDGFLRRQGFASTLAYLQDCRDLGTPPLFKGPEYLRSLFQARCVREGTHILVVNSGEQGYFVSGIATLLTVAEGIEHEPDEVLSKDAAPDGWKIMGRLWLPNGSH